MANFWEQDALVEAPKVEAPKGSVTVAGAPKEASQNFWERDALVNATPKEESPMLGSLEKGVVGAKQAVKQAQLASLIDLQEADKVAYGANYENAPQEELAKIQARDKSIQEKLQSVAQYGVERKEIEAKRGVNPLMQEVRNIGSSDTYKNADTLDQLKMYGDAIWSKKSDIPGYIASIGLEALPASLPSIASALVARVGGLGVKGAAIAGGTGSAFTEFGNQYAELRAEGLSHKEAWEKAGVKSGVIGMFDAASFHSAGSGASNIMRNIEKGAIKATVKETGKEISTQALYGMAGEAGGSLAIGQKLDPIQIIEEGLGEVVGAPVEAVTTYQKNKAKAATEPKFVEDEKGNLIPNPELVKERQIETLRKKAAETKNEGEVVAIMDQIKELEKPVVAAPITTGAQQDLFTKEEAPFQVSPDVRTTETATGKPLEVEAPQAPERQQAELQRQLDALRQQEQTPEVQAQITALQQQIPETPEQRIAALRDQFDVLERERVALQETHAAAPDLKTKGDIVVRSRAIFEQQQALENEIKGLRKEVGVTETARPGTEKAAIPEQGALEFQVSPIVDDKVLDSFGFTKKATKIKDQLRDLDMNKPEDREKLLDQVAKHERKGAKVDMQAVEDYVNNFTQPQEAPNVPRSVVSGAIPGGSQPSVPVPSGAVTPTQATAAPIAGRMAGNIPIAGGVDAGEAGVSAQGTATVAPTTQAVPVAVPTTQAAAAVVPTTEVEASRQLSAKFNAGNPTPVKTNWFSTKLAEWQKVREGNLNIGSFLFGTLQNFASSDQAYQNLMRKIMFDLAKAGDVTFKQARQALMRIATTQATKRAELAKEMLKRGAWKYDPINNWWTATDDANNIGVFDELTTQLAERLGVTEEEARKMMDDGYEANRLDSYYEDLNKAKAELTRTQKKVDLLQKTRNRTKAEQKDLNTKINQRDKLAKDVRILEGKVQHKDRAQVQAGMELYNMHPEIKEGTRVWNDMRARTIKTLVDVGMMTEEKAQQWLDEAAYVPFFRDIGEQAAATPDKLVARGIRETMAPLRAQQVGSMLKVSSTTQNMKEWMQWALAGAVSNQQLNTMIDSYKAVLPDEVRAGKGLDGTTFTVYRDGVELSFNVDNPAIAQAFTRVAPIIFPGFAAYKAVNNFSRHSITRFPLFSVAQVPADLYAAFFTSGIKNPLGLVINLVKEIGLTTVGMSETRDKMKASAIINTEDFNAMNEADAIGQKLGKVTTSKYKKAWQWAMHTLDKFAAVSDNVVRQAVYNELVREGKSEQEAMTAAAEIINFRRMSANAKLQELSQTTMFFNPWLQILSVTMKTLSGKGITPQTRAAGLKVLGTVSAQVFALGFLVAAANGTEDEQEKKARQIRDRLIMIPGTGGMGIPIRMDIWAIPYFMGQDAYHIMMKHEFVDFKSVTASLAAAVKGSLLPPTEGVAQIVRAPVEAALNKDIHNNRDLVNPTLRRLDPEMQFTKATSELAKVLGEMGGVAPIKIDHVIRGYFGTTATLFNIFANGVIADMRGIPRPSETVREKLSKLPSIGVGIGKEDDSGAGAISDFYEMSDDIRTVIDTAKKIARTDMPKAEAYLEKNKNKLVGSEAISKALSTLRNAENDILNAPAQSIENPAGMSSAEKATALKEINAERKGLTKDIREMRKQVYK